MHTPLRSLSQRRNRLRRILLVQEVYNQEAEEGLPFVFIWRKFIRDRFCIEYRTFLEYISIQAKKELEEINRQIAQIKEEKQLKMKNPNQPTFFAILLLATAAMPGCGLLQKAIEPDWAAECARRYPVTETVTVDSVEATVDFEIADFDTIYIDTIVCPTSPVPLTIYDTTLVSIPGKRVYVTTTRLDSTWYLIDTAANAALAERLAKAEQERDAARANGCPADSGAMPWWWLLITAAGGALVARFYKKKK